MWMSSKRSASIIIGILIGQATCQILVQVSHNLLYWQKTSRRIYVVRVRDWRESSWHPGQNIYSQSSGNQWESTPSWRKAKVVSWKAPSWKRTKIARDLFHRPWGYGIRKKLEILVALAMHCEILKSCGSGASNIIETTCVHSGSEWIHKNAYGNSIPQNHEDHIAGKGWKFITALQLGSQIYSYASSSENSCSESSGGQGMGKIGHNFGVGTWQKSEVRKRWSMKQGRRAQKFISPHWHLSSDKCWIGGKAPKNTKVKLYSVVILQKMIQTLMQYSLKKDLQHLKWQQLKSWISSPDCQVAMEKQETQYQRTPQQKWKMLKNYWKFQNRSVETFGFVYHDTNGQNHGPVWKTQSFLSSGICTVIFWQDHHGERQFEKIILQHGWEKIPNWECLFVHRQKGLFLSVHVDDIKLAGDKILIRCGNYSTKKSIWENQHLSWIMCTWAALKDNAKQAKILWTITEPCSHREFPRWEMKNLHTVKIFVFLNGLVTWLVMKRSVWNDIVS